MKRGESPVDAMKRHARVKALAAAASTQTP
jgi:hypothetical protein